MNLSIGGWDLLILVSYLLLVILFGLWIGRGKKDLDAYLLGGRDVPWWALLGSIIATETSTATFLSVPGIAYAHGTGDLRFLQLALRLQPQRRLFERFCPPFSALGPPFSVLGPPFYVI